MTGPTKVVFPPPPPTTNSLTSQQRSQLMRTTKKLGWILGSAPHLIDTNESNSLGTVRVRLPFHESERRPSPPPRTSLESVSSDASSISHASSSSVFTRSSGSSVRSNSARLTKSPLSSEAGATNSRPSRRPPVLRLTRASSPSTLETIPASPHHGSTIYSHSRSSSIDEFEDTRYTLRPNAAPSGDSIASPSFLIPSSNSVRLQKMDRLRRKLGEGVPLGLVFPQDTDVADSACIDTAVETTIPVLPPSPRPRSAGRIIHTRDSIASSSPHHARRKPVVVQLTASRPAPPPPFEPRRHTTSGQENLSELGGANDSRKEKLCAIQESPDETFLGEYSDGRSRVEGVLSEWYWVARGGDELGAQTWGPTKMRCGEVNGDEGKKRSWTARKAVKY